MKQIKKRLFATILCMLVVVALIALVACNDIPEQSKKLDHITLNTDNVTKEFASGDELSCEGLVVTAHYDDETTATVTTYTATANNLVDGKLSVNSDTVTVSYTEGDITKTETYGITVTGTSIVDPEKELVSIAINQEPTTTKYYVGETISTDGLKIDLKYDDDSTETVTSGYAVSTVSTATAGEQTVVVTYGGKTASFTINVYDKLTGLLVNGTTDYNVGDTFAGVTVSALYNEATTDGVSLTEGYNVSISPELNDNKFDTVGSYTVTVTYSEEEIAGRKLEVSESLEITVTDSNVGGGDDNLPHVTQWDTVGDPIYGEVYENDSDYIWHHLFLNDAVAQEYDFDGYVATVTVDGAASEIVIAQEINADNIAAHTYHLHMRIKGNRYQTTVFTIQFKKDGKTVATGTYTRVGDKEILLDSYILTISQGKSETVSITSVNGKTDLVGLNITWSIVDTEGSNVATIPADSNGSTVEVTAVSVGKATLTCTVGEGDDAFSKTCVITVVEGDVEIVVVDVSEQIVYNNKFTTSKEAVQIYCNLTDAKFAELVQQIDPSQTTVTVTMDGKASTCNVIRKEWQAVGVYNLWIQIEVESDWTHDYVFEISFKNAKGDEIATATYEEIAPATLTLNPTTLTLKLISGETVTGIITATKTSKVEGEIQWSIDDNTVASFVNNGDGTITVTALKKGTTTIKATVDGLEQTCTINVLDEDEEAPKKESTFTLVFEEVYGSHYMHFSTTSDLPADFSFDYVKVYKDDDTVGTQRWSEFANGHIRIYVTDTPEAFDGEWKFEFYKDGQVVATVYFTYPVASSLS